MSIKEEVSFYIQLLIAPKGIEIGFPEEGFGVEGGF